MNNERSDTPMSPEHETENARSPVSRNNDGEETQKSTERSLLTVRTTPDDILNSENRGLRGNRRITWNEYRPNEDFSINHIGTSFHSPRFSNVANVAQSQSPQRQQISGTQNQEIQIPANSQFDPGQQILTQANNPNDPILPNPLTLELDKKVRERISQQLQFFAWVFIIATISLLKFTYGNFYDLIFLIAGAIYAAIIVVKEALSAFNWKVTSKKRFLFYFLDSISIGVYIALAFMRINAKHLKLTPVGFFPVMLAVIFIIIACREKKSDLSILILMFKVIFWLQIVLLSFKLDGTPIEWNILFLPTLLFIIVLMFISTLIFFSFILALIGASKAGIGYLTDIIGSFWYLMIAIFSICVYLNLNSLEAELNRETWAINFKLTLWITFCQSATFLVYTILLRKYIVRFLQFDMDIETRNEPQQEGPQQAQEIKFEKAEGDNSYLAAVTSTLYTRARNLVNPKYKSVARKIKKQIKHLKKINNPKTGGDPNINISEIMKNEKINSSFFDTKLSSEPNIKREDVSASKSNLDKEEKEGSSINEKVCFVCFANEPDAVIMECGHGGICYQCAIDSWKKSNDCIICRNPIDKILKVQQIPGVKLSKVTDAVKKIVIDVEIPKAFDNLSD